MQVYIHAQISTHRFPEPPANTNHNRQYGPISGTWAAAQKGLMLRLSKLPGVYWGVCVCQSCEIYGMHLQRPRQAGTDALQHGFHLSTS